MTYGELSHQLSRLDVYIQTFRNLSNDIDKDDHVIEDLDDITTEAWKVVFNESNSSGIS